MADLNNPTGNSENITLNNEVIDKKRQDKIKNLIKEGYSELDDDIKVTIGHLIKVNKNKQIEYVTDNKLYNKLLDKTTNIILQLEKKYKIILPENNLKLIGIKIFLELSKANKKTSENLSMYDKNLEINIINETEVNMALKSLQEGLNNSFSNITISPLKGEIPKGAIVVKNIDELIIKYNLTDKQVKDITSQLSKFTLEDIKDGVKITLVGIGIAFVVLGQFFTAFISP